MNRFLDWIWKCLRRVSGFELSENGSRLNRNNGSFETHVSLQVVKSHPHDLALKKYVGGMVRKFIRLPIVAEDPLPEDLIGYHVDTG